MNTAHKNKTRARKIERARQAFQQWEKRRDAHLSNMCIERYGVALEEIRSWHTHGELNGNQFPADYFDFEDEIIETWTLENQPPLAAVEMLRKASFSELK